MSKREDTSGKRKGVDTKKAARKFLLRQPRPVHEKHPRKAKYYKLGEKDHETIIEGLSKFVPVYVIAQKIGCGYHTLCDYIERVPELAQVQKDASDNEIAFAKGKLFQKIGAGHAASIMFFLERADRAHFGRNVQIENIGDLPTIQIGNFTEADFVESIDPSADGKTAAEMLDAAAERAREAHEAEEAEEDDGDE